MSFCPEESTASALRRTRVSSHSPMSIPRAPPPILAMRMASPPPPFLHAVEMHTLRCSSMGQGKTQMLPSFLRAAGDDADSICRPWSFFHPKRRRPKDGMPGQDYSGMYCAVLTVGSTAVSVALLRVMGGDIAELPLVATSMDLQGLVLEHPSICLTRKQK